jgi:glutamine synthetase
LKSAGVAADTTLLQSVSAPVSALTAALAGLKDALAVREDSALAEALHARDTLLPTMSAVRQAADNLEGLVADDLWPLPTYQEMLFIL